MQQENTASKVQYIYDISIFLLYWMTGIIITTALSFLVGISINAMNLIFPTLMAILITYYRKYSVKDTFLIVGIGLVLIYFSILVSMAVYDHTWDGASYHKQAVGFLKEGWNPIYQSAFEFNKLSNSIQWPCDNPMYWAEAYPKASWYFAAPIYFLTGNIESGKAYTILFMIILFGICYEYMNFKGMSSKRAVLVSSLAAINPIVLAQMQSYYLDGIVICLLLSLFIMFISYFDDKSSYNQYDRFGSIACFIVIGCNLKFSVTYFIALNCILFFICFMWKHRNEIKKTIRLFLYFSILSSFSIAVIGFSPYITNMMRYGNMFQGLTTGSANLLGSDNMQNTFGIPELSNGKMFFASLFGKMSHGEYQSLPELLKVPFTFSKKELNYYYYVDTRISGFGILFSGIIILSTLIIACVIWKRKYKGNSAFLFSLVLISANVVSMLILPATFTARYIGQLYFIPLFAIALLLLSMSKKFITNFAATALIFCMIGNMIPFINPIMQRIDSGSDTTISLKNMENISKEKQLEIAFWAYDFTGMHYNLKDFNISYDYILYEDTDESFSKTNDNWIAYKY